MLLLYCIVQNACVLCLFFMFLLLKLETCYKVFYAEANVYNVYTQVAGAHFHHHSRAHQCSPHAPSSAHLTPPPPPAAVAYHEVDNDSLGTVPGPPARQMMAAAPATCVTTNSSSPVVTGNLLPEYQGRRSLWDRGDTSPQYLDWGT